MADIALQDAPRAPSAGGRLARLRARYFQSPRAALATVLFGAVMLCAGFAVLDWAVLSAHWAPGTPADCAAASGACWAFVWEKWSVILLGAFPRAEMWRPLVGVGAVIAVLVYLGWRRWPQRQSIVLVGTAFLVLWALLDGRALGLAHVDMVRWHGVAVVAFLGVFSLFAALPLGIVLALARVDGPPAVAILATGYIEVIRAVPLVTVLFFGIFVLPLLLPPSVDYAPLVVTLAALTLFHAAYFAEDVRGGLQAVAKGQHEAGEALGIGYATRTRCIVLPQALSISIPSLTNTIIGGFKDTSLVAIVGIFDLLATTRMAYSDPEWQRYAFEGLVFVGFLYLVTCSAISRHSRAMESHVAGWLHTGK